MILFFTEKYFDMNKKLARDALDIYKKFLIRMDRVADFLKVAEVSFILLNFRMIFFKKNIPLTEFVHCSLKE